MNNIEDKEILTIGIFKSFIKDIFEPAMIKIDERFLKIDNRFTDIDDRFSYLESKMDDSFIQLESKIMDGFTMLDKKIDFVDQYSQDRDEERKLIVDIRLKKLENKLV